MVIILFAFRGNCLSVLIFLELHPLALEDVLHTRPDNLSKADYFLHHLFLRILIHNVEDESSMFVVEDSALDPSAPTSEDVCWTVFRPRTYCLYFAGYTATQD